MKEILAILHFWHFYWKITVKWIMEDKTQNKFIIFPEFWSQVDFSTILGVWESHSTHDWFPGIQCGAKLCSLNSPIVMRGSFLIRSSIWSAFSGEVAVAGLPGTCLVKESLFLLIFSHPGLSCAQWFDRVLETRGHSAWISVAVFWHF